MHIEQTRTPLRRMNLKLHPKFLNTSKITRKEQSKLAREKLTTSYSKTSNLLLLPNPKEALRLPGIKKFKSTFGCD